MMEEMIRIAEELRVPLYGRLSNTTIRPFIQGAILEVDRYWYYWWADQGISIISGDIARVVKPVASLAHPTTPLAQPSQARPVDWPNHCKAMGYPYGASPFVIVVILRDHPRTPHRDLPRDFNAHPIRYEVRPPAVATNLIRDMSVAFGKSDAKPLSIGRTEPNTAGTLGGFLYCPATDRKLIVTCAHVLGPVNSAVYVPGPFEHKRSRRIGTVLFSAIPPLKQGGECNLMAMPLAGRLDVSVANYTPDDEIAMDIEPAPLVNRLRTVAQMVPYQPVEFIGKESGCVKAQLGGVTLWHEIETESFGDGNAKGSRCFGVLFEITDLEGDRNEVAVGGDSGAWVFDRVQQLRSWDGMVIARQGKRAYGCYAEFILNALNQDRQFPNGVAISW